MGDQVIARAPVIVSGGRISRHAPRVMNCGSTVMNCGVTEKMSPFEGRSECSHRPRRKKGQTSVLMFDTKKVPVPFSGHQGPARCRLQYHYLGAEGDVA